MHTAYLPYTAPDFKGHLFGVILILETLLALIFIKSPTLGVAAALLLAGAFFLFLSPEFAFASALTTNVLVYFTFDYLDVSIHLIALMTYLFMLVTASAFYIIRSSAEIDVKGKLLWLALAIALIMILGLPRSSNRWYAVSKISLYFIFNIPPLLLIPLFKNDLKRIDNLLAWTYLLGLLLAGICFLIARNKLFFAFQRFSPSDEINPIILSRSLGISLIAALYLLFRPGRAPLKLLIMISLPLLFLPVMWSGSRAPLIGLFLSLLLYYILQPSQSLFRKISVSAASISLSLLFFLHSTSQVTARIATPLTQEASSAFRVFAWIKGVQDFLSAPFTGIGTGSFLMNISVLEFIYPHNLLLELACENGIIGLALITVFIVLALKYGVMNIQRFGNTALPVQLSIASLSLFCFALWNAMFSGDIATNPIVWFAAGMIWALHIAGKSAEKET